MRDESETDLEAEIDPADVEIKWSELESILDAMMNRVGDPNDFPVESVSSLAGDDKASFPYSVSHAARMCLVAGVDHLHAVKCLTRDLGVIHNASPFSLVRGALENLCAAFWILHPPSLRNDRVERALRWHAKNFYDQNTALKPRGLSDNTARDAKLAKLAAIAAARKIHADIRKGYSSTEAVTYVEEKSNRAKPLLSWRFCSGYAHGRPWAYLGMSERESFPTADPGVLNMKLTTDPTRLLAPTLEAVLVLTDVVELLQERARR